MVNTTSSVRGDTPRGHVVNTTENTIDTMSYEDEELEVIHTTPALDWCAVVGGENVPLILFATLENGRTYGVALGSDGRIDVSDDVEDRDGFEGYQKGEK